MLLGGQTTVLHVDDEHLPFLPVAPYSTAWSHKPHPSQIVRLEERKIVGRLGLSHCSQPSRIMLQHVTKLCACHGRLPSIGLFGDAKQAMGEGKSGPVETGLTGPVATALSREEPDISLSNVNSKARLHLLYTRVLRAKY